MHHVGSEAQHCSRDNSCRSPRPYGVRRQPNTVTNRLASTDRRVVQDECPDGVTRTGKESRLTVKDHVLAASLLVAVVDDQHAQAVVSRHLDGAGAKE